MPETQKILILSRAEEYIDKIPPKEKASLLASINALARGDNDVVETKQLDGPIRELIVGNHRVTYFGLSGSLYVIEGFRKKSKKTPKTKIDFAKNIYKIVKSQ
jgi:phage-related protein